MYNKSVKTYENVNREQRSLSFGISKMEDIYAKHQGKVDDPHRHAFYTMLLVKEGKGTHTIDFKTYPLQDKQIYFISPAQVHQLKEEKASKGYSIVFSADFLLKNHIPIRFIEDLNLFRSCGESPPLHLEDAQLAKIEKKIEEMYNTFHSAETMKMESIGALLKLVLIACRQFCTTGKNERLSEQRKGHILKEFKALVESHHLQWHKSKTYASAMNMSVDHLNRVVKELTGQTCKTHIQNRLIIAAKRHLYFSELSLKEIAFELGFEESTNFSAFFKKYTGQSPSEFLKKA